MKWLTNSHKRDVDRFIMALSPSRPDASIVLGDPQATGRFTVEELFGMGMIGIYEKENDACSR